MHSSPNDLHTILVPKNRQYYLYLIDQNRSKVTVLTQLLSWYRVLEIMRRDAEKDPETNPSALHARRLINQVSFNPLIF